MTLADFDPDDDIGTVRWFGTPWPSPEKPAPVCQDPRAQVDVPLGKICISCSFAFRPSDQGVGIPFLSDEPPAYVWYHLRCWLRQVLPDAIVAYLPGDEPR